MLFALAALLFLVWVIGVAFEVTVSVIHVALIASVALFILAVFRRRAPVP